MKSSIIDQGFYFCHSFNEFGSTMKQFQLKFISSSRYFLVFASIFFGVFIWLFLLCLSLIFHFRNRMNSSSIEQHHQVIEKWVFFFSCKLFVVVLGLFWRCARFFSNWFDKIFHCCLTTIESLFVLCHFSFSPRRCRTFFFFFVKLICEGGKKLSHIREKIFDQQLNIWQGKLSVLKGSCSTIRVKAGRGNDQLQFLLVHPWRSWGWLEMLVVVLPASPLKICTCSADTIGCSVKYSDCSWSVRPVLCPQPIRTNRWQVETSGYNFFGPGPGAGPDWY